MGMTDIKDGLKKGLEILMRDTTIVGGVPANTAAGCLP